MGYNLSKATVRRNLPQLEQLRDAKKTLFLPSSNPERLAYKLREAMRAAEKHEEDFPGFTQLRQQYRLRALEEGVICEWLISSPIKGVVLGQEGEPESRPPESSPSRTSQKPYKKTLPEVEDSVDMLASALTFSGESELHFPNVQLSHDDKERIAGWCEGQEWKLIDHHDAGATLTKFDVDPSILYTPESES